MAEWWTYRLEDFLLFAPQTYYRLFELYNAALWPAQLVALALGGTLVGQWWYGRGRALAAVLAGCWLWVAWAFHVRHYATINWAATWFALGFAGEALLLFWSGVIRGRLRFGPLTPANALGLGVLLFALLVQPLLGPLLGRDWAAVELFGMAPDPTAVATLGVLLLAARRHWLLLWLPLLWCAVSGATLWALAAADAGVLPGLALLVGIVTLRKTPQGNL